MKKMQRAVLAAVIAIAGMGVTACDNTLAPSLDWELTVAITSGSNLPDVGDVVQFGAFVTEGGQIESDDLNVAEHSTWSVLGPAGVVSITQTGRVTALAPGAVVIQAVFSGRTGNQSLIVE